MSIESRSRVIETIEEEGQTHVEAAAVEREKLADRPESAEFLVPQPESREQTRYEESEPSPEAPRLTIPPMKKEGVRHWAPLLVVLLSLVSLSFLIGIWVYRTEWTGGEGEIHPIVAIREKPATENIGGTSVEAMSQPGETPLVPLPTAELDQREVQPEPVGANLSEAEESLLPSPPVEVSGSEGPQAKETGEEVARLKGLEESPPESLVASGGYTVNLASFKKRARAERYLEELKEQGLQGFVWEAEVPQKGTWYRVSIGGFSTIEQAQLLAKDLKQRGFKTFVTRFRGGRPKPTHQEPTPFQDQELRRLLRS